ncbi:hypothetical protein FCULG_00009357 [Fusarium culmorum]|uniref:WSC domain-containing protein n=1 Tax=Fusarium culmorum TaxID=5516 RepID=A0A2T4GHA9_FUSCU|nr:hypothetical protein FCULG_00009357 [Fusarium culmorum]
MRITSVRTVTTSLAPTTVTGTTNGLSSSSSIETTASPSSSSVASFAFDLRDAVLGPGSSFYPPPDGDSILMSPVAVISTLNRRQAPIDYPFPVRYNSNTAFVSFKANVGPDFASSLGVPVQRITSVKITSITEGRRKRAESTPCVFELFVDGEIALAAPITGGFGSLTISTNPVLLEELAIQNGEGASSTPIPSIIIGTPTTSSSGTNSASLTANSEGETTFPTDTSPEASSDATTTPLGGETISTTGTATGTISGSFTTNSEGETIFPTEITTEANSSGSSTSSEDETTGTATGTSPSATATATLPAGFPSQVGDFTLFGCIASTAGFPSFSLAQSNSDMDLDICSTLCARRAYFGVYNTDCYCGDEIGPASSRVDLDQCDIECPGDNTQFCGGESNSKLRARQAISSNLLLTVYIAIEVDVTLTQSVTQTVTDQRTVITTFTTTTTATNTEASTTATEVITATLVCSSGKCHSINSVTVYTFVEIKGRDHNGQWVYVSEPCSCAGGQRYTPKFCSKGNCDNIKIYKPQQCPDWYNYNMFFIPTDTACSTCPSGEIVYQPWENSWGTPDNCNDVVPTCSGHDCPSQKNVVRPYQGASGGGSKSSSDNGDSGNSWGGSSPGSNGESSGGYNGDSNDNSNGGSNCGSNSGTEEESQSSNNPSSKGSYPSTVPVISGASSHVFSVVSLISALAALLYL